MEGKKLLRNGIWTINLLALAEVTVYEPMARVWNASQYSLPAYQQCREEAVYYPYPSCDSKVLLFPTPVLDTALGSDREVQ